MAREALKLQQRLPIAVFCFLIPWIARAQEAETPITDKERWESRVLQWVADMSVDRDTILQRRYVVLVDSVLIEPETLMPTGSGETFSMEKIGIPHEYTHQRIFSRQHNRFDYRAIAQIQPRPNLSSFADPQSHTWLEYLHSKSVVRGRQLRVRDDQRAADPYADKPKDKSAGEWWKETSRIAAGFTPYDSFLPHVFMRSSEYLPEPLEKTFFERGELTKVTPEAGGLMRSEWNVNTAFKPVVLSIKHDPKKNWMPTEIGLKPGKGWPDNVKLDSYVRLSNWQKIDGFWLPQIVEQSQDIGGSDRKDIRLAKLRWAIGKDAPDAAFDVDSKDLREPVMKHFNAEFMAIKDGRLSVAPFYETPEDLLQSFQPKPTN